MEARRCGLRLIEIRIAAALGGRARESDALPDGRVAQVERAHVRAQLAEKRGRRFLQACRAVRGPRARVRADSRRTRTSSRASFAGVAEPFGVERPCAAVPRPLRNPRPRMNRRRTRVARVRRNDAIRQRRERRDVVEGDGGFIIKLRGSVRAWRSFRVGVLG